MAELTRRAVLRLAATAAIGGSPIAAAARGSAGRSRGYRAEPGGPAEPPRSGGWHNPSPDQSWFLDVVHGPERDAVIAGGDDAIGIYLSPTGRPPWRKVERDFAAYTVAVSPHRRRTVFAGDPYGRGIRRSVDGGRTWTKANRGFPRGPAPAAVAWIEPSPHDPAVVWAAAATADPPGDAAAGLWRSDTLGSRWYRAGFDGVALGAVHHSPHHPDLVLVGVGGRFWGPGGIHRSTDSGRTWDGPELADHNIVNFVSDPSEPGRIHAAVPGIGVMTSLDAGRTWTAGVGQDGGEQTWGVRADPSDPARLYSLVVVGVAASFRSDDRGTTWQPAGPAGHVAIGLGVTNGGALYVSTYGDGFLRSDDQGATWTDVGEGLRHSYVYSPVDVDPRDPARLLLALHAGYGSPRLVRSDDGGATFQAVRTPTVEAISNAYVIARHPTDHDRLYVACLTADGSPEVAGVWESTDGGRSFAVTGLTGRNCVSVAVCPAEPKRLLAGTQDGGIFVSDDGGRRWRAGGLAGLYVASFAFDPAHPTTVVASAGGKGWATNDPTGFWRSDDSGRNWRQLPVAADRGGYQAAFDPSTPGTVYFAHQGGLSVSTDGGAEPSVLLDRPSDLGASVAVDTAGGVYYSGTNYRADTAGVLLASANRGRTWRDIGEGCATREVWSLTVDQVGRLWGSSFGSGLWLRSPAGAG